MAGRRERKKIGRRDNEENRTTDNIRWNEHEATHRQITCSQRHYLWCDDDSELEEEGRSVRTEDGRREGALGYNGVQGKVRKDGKKDKQEEKVNTWSIHV